MRLGLFERAIPRLQEALDIARQAENLASQCVNETRLAWIDIQRRELDSAAKRLKTAEALASRGGGTSQRLLVSSTLARLHLMRSSAEEALKNVEHISAKLTPEEREEQK